MLSLSFDSESLHTGQTTSDSLSFSSLEVSLGELAQVVGSDCGCDAFSQSFPLPLFPLVPLPIALPPLWSLLQPFPWPLPLKSGSLLLLSLKVSFEELVAIEGSDLGFL